MYNEDFKATFTPSPDSASHVIVIEDPSFRKTIILEEAAYSIGRDAKNSIVLSSKRVSRYHATLLRRRVDLASNKNFAYWILDGDLKGNRSTNGLFVNDKRCLVQELKHGDLIKLGFEVKATYYILNNKADVLYLQSGDFKEPSSKASDSKESIVESQSSMVGAKSSIVEPQSSIIEGKITKIDNRDISQKTLIISEPSLEKSEDSELAKLASFPELSPNPIIEIDWEGNITYLNPAAINKFKDLQQRKIDYPILTGLTKNCENQQGSLFFREVKIGGQIFEQYIHYLSDKKLIRSYIFDFTKRRQIQGALRESEQRYLAVLKQTSEGIFMIDANSKRLLEANAVYCELLGYSLEEIRTLTVYDVVALDTQLIDRDLERVFKEKLNYVSEQQHRAKDGSLIKVDVNISPISYGQQHIFSFTVRDLTVHRHKEENFRNQSLHDLLTGLPSKNLLKEQLVTSLANARRTQNIICVMFLELDDFQNINQNLSYEIGDQLLQGFAKRLRSCLRAGDTVARWSGNKFTVLLPQVRSIKDLGKIGTRILDSLRQPFDVEKQKIQVKLSMGIAVHPDDGFEAEVILENANAALYRSQEKGWNNYQFYTEIMNSQVSRLLRLEKLLHHALQHEELILNYQPQINLKTKKVTGMETLLRWQHPELGQVLPAQFLPLAEETGLIVPIGEWLLRVVCNQNKIWQTVGLPNSSIGVNLSMIQFQQPNLVAMISEILEQTGLEPSLLELEITEKTIMENIDTASNTLDNLKSLGVRMCLDDFGSGYSAFGLVKRFSFNTLKIAQSVIQDLTENSSDIPVISAVISLGKDFNIRVVAEGVDSKEKLELLKQLGCEEIQGNLFSPPLSLEDADELLASVEGSAHLIFKMLAGQEF